MKCYFECSLLWSFHTWICNTPPLTLTHELAGHRILPPQLIHFSTACSDMRFRSVCFSGRWNTIRALHFLEIHIRVSSQNSSVIYAMRRSHFWRPRTPCLWPLGTRSWAGPRCPERGRPHQTSHSPYPPRRRSHLGGQTGRWLLFLKWCKSCFSLLFCVFWDWENLMNGWHSCLCVVSASSQMSSAACCQQQKASWSCSHSSCHCEEERSSLVSAEHSHTQAHCCPNTLVLRTFWIVNTSILLSPPHTITLSLHTKKNLTRLRPFAAWRCGSSSLLQAWSTWRIPSFGAESWGGLRSSSTPWSPAWGLKTKTDQIL